MAEFGNAAARSRYKILKRLKKAVREYARVQIAEGPLASMTPQEQESLKDYDPLFRMALLEIDPQTPRSMKLLCQIELAKYFHSELKEPIGQIDSAGGGGGAPVVGLISYSSKPAPEDDADLHTRAIEPERQEGEPRRVEAEVVDDEPAPD